MIPDKTQTIEKQVFSQCSALKYVTLGSGVKTIGRNAFNECYALEWVLCDIETPPTLEGTPFPVTQWGWTPYTAEYKIYVPDSENDEIVNAYRTAWSAYWFDDPDKTPYVDKSTKVIYPISEKKD